MNEALIPSGFEGEGVTTLGLLSDTHLPDRRRELPPTLSSIFDGVDLLLHAGDVGELAVLEELSAIAPVLAVHGNDDTEEAQRELPERQLLAVGGRRLLLWHSHHPHRATELRFREADDWASKLVRIRKRARQARATIAVFGHIHVPLAQREKGILLVNPGALASGNPFTRQVRQTVALLFLRDDWAVAVRHVDVTAPNEVFEPEIAWSEGFPAALNEVSETIVASEVAALANQLHQGEFAEPETVWVLYRRLAHRCWAGELAMITGADLLAALDETPIVTAADKEKIRELLR